MSTVVKNDLRLETVNGVAITEQTTGFTITGGSSSSKTLTITDDFSGPVTGTTPALVLATAQLAGLSTHFIRSDDSILVFDATSPTTQAFGDSAVVGTASTAARRDHKHGMPAAPSGTTPALVLATAQVAGLSSYFLRADDSILVFDGTAPTTQAFGDSAATGSASTAARRDHKHAMPAKPTYEVDALIDYGSGTSYTKATIDAALAGIVGSAKTTILIRPGVWTIDADTAWSSYTYATFKIAKGAVFKLSTTVAMTFPGVVEGLTDNFQQVFNLPDLAATTQVNFSVGSVPFVRPEWFGVGIADSVIFVNTVPGTTDMTKSIQAAVNSIPSTGGIVLFDSTTYLVAATQAELNNTSRVTDGVVLKSNITLQGCGNQSIIRQAVLCAVSFTFRLLAAVTDPDNNPHDVNIYDLCFDKPSATFFGFSWHINVDSVTRMNIERCYFKNWSGDAISVGTNLRADTDAWLQSYIRNLTINECFFDGVSTDNRQCISFLCGENVNIKNCYFTRSTRVTMPGAIDIEPEHTWAIIRNFTVEGNTFEGIGGGSGVVTFSLGFVMTLAPYNINIVNNKFIECNDLYDIQVLGPYSTDQNAVHPSSPSKIHINGNIIYHKTTGLRVFSIIGVKDITLDNNKVYGGGVTLTSGSYIANHLLYASYFGWDGAYDDTPSTLAKPIENFSFKYNLISDYYIEGAYSAGILGFYGAIHNGDFSGNEFINCGNCSSGVPTYMTVVQFAPASTLSKNVRFENNSFINTFFNDASYPIFIPSGLAITYPDYLTAKRNTYIGFDTSPYTSQESFHYSIPDSDYYPGFITLENTTTPTVAGGSKFVAANALTITNFDDGKFGQIISILATTNVTITNGTNIFLSDNSNWSMASLDTLSLMAKILWTQTTGTFTATPPSTVVSTATFTFAATATVVASEDCYALGVRIGQLIFNSTDDTVASGKQIIAISSDYKTLTLISSYSGTTGSGKTASVSGKTVTMTSDLTSTMPARTPLQYVIGGVTYYAHVDAITSNLLTIAGDYLNGDITALYWGSNKWYEVSRSHNASTRSLTVITTEYLPISTAIDGTAAPAAISTLTSTNKVNVRDFDSGSDEDVFFIWQVPRDISGTTITYRVITFVTNATGPSNEGVAFFLKGASLGDGDILSGALGTAVISSWTGKTEAQYDRIATAFSNAVTITNLAAGETAILNLYRDVSDGADTYGQDIGVSGIEIKYTRILANS